MLRFQTIKRVAWAIIQIYGSADYSYSMLVRNPGRHKIWIISEIKENLWVSPYEASEFLWLFEDVPSITREIWTKTIDVLLDYNVKKENESFDIYSTADSMPEEIFWPMNTSCTDSNGTPTFDSEDELPDE